VKQIELLAVDYKAERKEVAVDNNSIAIVLQSFYLFRTATYAASNPNYLALLIYHFIAAFSELGSRLRFPKCAEDIQELCIM